MLVGLNQINENIAELNMMSTELKKTEKLDYKITDRMSTQVRLPEMWPKDSRSIKGKGNTSSTTKTDLLVET